MVRKLRVKESIRGNNPLPRPGRRLIRYEERFARIAFARALLGDTLEQIAEIIGCRVETIYKWQRKIPAFEQAMKGGKVVADDEVAVSLFRRATGYSHDTVKIFADAKTGAIVEVPYTERYPPDTTACIFWLCNRRPDMWRHVNRHEVTGAKGGPITYEEVDAAKKAAAAELRVWREVSEVSA